MWGGANTMYGDTEDDLFGEAGNDVLYGGSEETY